MEKAYSQLKDYLTTTGISEHDVEKVISYFNFKKVKRNEFLELCGKISKHMYFINKGCLRLYEIDKKGNDVTAFFALEGIFFSALPSFITQKPSIDFLVAHEASELLVIERSDFFKIIAEFPQFAKLYHQSIEFAFIHSQMRIYMFLGMEGIDRLKWVMEHEPKLLTRISSKSVASYLGMTSSTLSKLKAKL